MTAAWTRAREPRRQRGCRGDGYRPENLRCGHREGHANHTPVFVVNRSRGFDTVTPSLERGPNGVTDVLPKPREAEKPGAIPRRVY